MIKIIISFIYFLTIRTCSGLTNNFNNSELLRKCGSHFQCVIPGIGILIHPYWCLTAAHNRADIGKPFELNNEHYLVEKVIVHPLHDVTFFSKHNYNFKYSTIEDFFPTLDYKYDIALIKINKPIFTKPYIERERNDTSRSSRNWVVSGKDGILKAGLARLCNVQKDVYYKSWTQKTVQPLISKTISLFFYNFQPDFDQKKYTFSDHQDKAIILSGLIPQRETSKLAVRLEQSDSSACTFNTLSDDNTSLPNLNDIKLTGIVIRSITPPSSNITDGYMGIVLRLSYSGLNEFIDTIILQDALGMDVNTLALHSNFKKEFYDTPILMDSNMLLAFGLPAFKINNSTFITPKIESTPLFLRKCVWVEDYNDQKKSSFLSLFIDKKVDKENLRFLKFSNEEFNTTEAKASLKNSFEEDTWTIYYPASHISCLPADFEYSSIKKYLINLIK